MTFTPFSLPTDPNAQILLNTTLSTQVQGTSTPLAVVDPQNRPGWYYNSTLQTNSMVWTIFNGTNQDFTLGDVQNLTFTATHDNTPNNKCYMAITSPFSRIVYENNNVDLIPGEKCLFYTNTIPQNPDNLRLVQLNLVNKTGPCSLSEKLMTITLEGTNATLFPDVLQVCVENIGFLLNPDTVQVIVNLQTNQTVNVSITGFATEATLSNLNNKIHNDTVHTDAIQVEVKNTASIPITNPSLTSLTFSGTSLNTVVTNTVPVSNTSLAALTFSGTSLNTVVNNTVPVSNTALTNMTFTGGALNVTIPATTPLSTSLPAVNYDSFGRFRVSDPFTLFDSSNRYADNGLWATSSATGGSATFNANQGLMDLIVTGTTNSQVTRETYKVFPYQPGKSLLVMNTFVGQTTAGLQQRIGYFGAQNGIYFQINDDGSCTIYKRSYITGGVVDTPVQQGQWNGNPLNGSPASGGITLDLTKAQILWMDFEWLGVGSVRIGFVINGQFIVCHTFQHANFINSTYITTASLPLRYEIINNGGVGGTLKQICSTVISEGGYQLNGSQLSVATPIGTAAVTTPAGTRCPIISIRLQSTRLDAIVILSAMNLIPSATSNDTYYWEIISKGTTGGGGGLGWSPVTNSSVETKIYGSTIGTITGGTVIASGFISSSNQSRGSIELLKEALFTFQLQRNTFTSTAYEITLCCTSLNGGSVFASIDWEEISR